MLLFIIRHAKAEADAADGTDASRKLTTRGHLQARWLASAVRTHVRGRIVLLASPITRARQTAEPLAADLGVPAHIEARLATESTVRACIEAIDDTSVEYAPDTLILIGHNPHFEALAACVLGEVCATSDVPAGVVNLLTGSRDELIPHLAEHREIDAVTAANLPQTQAEQLRMGAANNLKRVLVREVDAASWFDAGACESPWWIEPTVEMKTIWHPSAA